MTSDRKRDELAEKAYPLCWDDGSKRHSSYDQTLFKSGYDAAMAEKDERVKEIKTSVEIKLLFLIGCCRMKNISKKQIEASIEQYIKTLKEMGE